MKSVLAIALSLSVIFQSAGAALAATSMQDRGGTRVTIRGFAPRSDAAPANVDLDLSAPTDAPDLADVRFESPAQAAQAALMIDQAIIARRPALAIVRDLQRQGADLEGRLPQSASAATFRTAAQTLPQGAVRQNLLAFAAATQVSASSAGGALDSAYGENARDLRPRYTPAGAESVPESVDPSIYKVPNERLRRRFDESALPASTREITGVDKLVVGQERAMSALDYGVTLPITPEWKDHNIYVSVPSDADAKEKIRAAVEAHAASLPTPPDVVQVTNPADHGQPLFLQVAPGQGKKLEEAFKQFIKIAKKALPDTLLETKEMFSKGDVMTQLNKQAKEQLAVLDKQVTKLKKRGAKFGVKVSLVKAPTGRRPQPMITYQGKMMDEEEFESHVKSKHFTMKELDDAMESYMAVLRQEGKDGKSLLEHYDDIGRWMDEQEKTFNESLQGADKKKATQLAAQLAEQSGLYSFAGSGSKIDEKAVEQLHEENKQLTLEALKKTETSIKIGQFEVRIGVAATPMGIIPHLDIETYKGKKVTPALMKSTKISKTEMEELQQQGAAAAEKVFQAFMQEKQKIDEATREKLKALAPSDPIGKWVDSIVKDVGEHFDAFLPDLSSDSMEEQVTVMLGGSRGKADPADRYLVKTLVDNSDLKGGRVIFEDSPTFRHLVGSVKSAHRMGALIGGKLVKMGGGDDDEIEDPELVAGSVLKATYIAIDAMKLLHNPGAYDWLMHMADTGVVEINAGGMFGRMIGDEGETFKIPHNVRIILYGSSQLGMLLDEYEEQFRDNFKVKAQFDRDIPINAETTGEVLSHFKAMSDRLKAAAASAAKAAGKSVEEVSMVGTEIDRSGLAALLENMTELAESNEKFSAQVGQNWDKIREAGRWAQRRVAKGEDTNPDITRADVERADFEEWNRRSQMERRMRETYVDGTWPYDYQGVAPNRINGVAVIMLSKMFGVVNPSTFKATPGKFEIDSVDRDSELVGPTGLRGIESAKLWLRGHFGAEKPMMTHFAVSNEHNLSGYDGDSGTLKEAVGLALTLAGVNIKQNGAMTGSMDIHGRAKPIGGEIEKLKNHFMLARDLGQLNKENPPFFVLPQMNVSGLALPMEIVKAVEAGLYEVYFVRYAEEAAEIFAEHNLPWAKIAEKAAAQAEKHREIIKELSKGDDKDNNPHAHDAH